MENGDGEGGLEHPGAEIVSQAPALPVTASHTLTVWDRVRERFRSLSFRSILSTLSTAATIVPAVSVVGALLWQIGLEGFDRSLAVEPISVPKSIDEDGYTPNVVAQRLEDTMRRIMIDSSTSMKRHRIASYSESGTAVNPGSSASLGVMISSTLHFLHLSARTYVSGEITRHDDKYWMTLRISGQDKVLCSLGPAVHVDDLLVPAARRVLWDMQPYMVASYDYTRNNDLALAEVIAIPTWLPDSNENVLRAINLKGLILRDRGKFDEAERAFKRALEIDPHFGIAHWNLGLLMVREKRRADGEREIQQAFSDGFRPAPISRPLTDMSIGNMSESKRHAPQAKAAPGG